MPAVYAFGVILLVLGIFCINLGEFKYVPFIVGGDDAKPAAFPFLAAIKRDDEYKCGGSLITPMHVLTARHCVQRTDLSIYEIVLGEHDRRFSDGTEQRFGVTQIIKHEDKHTDVALVVMNRNATVNDDIMLVDLATTLPPLGTEVTAMGWGYIQSQSSRSAYILQTVNIPIANNFGCLREYGEGHPREKEICVGDQTKSSYTNICRGDSGSPIVYNNTYSNGTNMVQQIGIVQGGHMGCPSSRRFAIAVNVPKIRDWVMRKLSEVPTEAPTTVVMTTVSPTTRGMTSIAPSTSVISTGTTSGDSTVSPTSVTSSLSTVLPTTKGSSFVPVLPTTGAPSPAPPDEVDCWKIVLASCVGCIIAVILIVVLFVKIKNEYTRRCTITITEPEPKKKKVPTATLR